MPDRTPGCICELDPKTGEPVVLGYAMCPIHKPDVVTPFDTAKELVEKFDSIDDCDNHQSYEGHICSHQAKQCAIICAQVILSCHQDDGMQYYWNDVIREIENI